MRTQMNRRYFFIYYPSLIVYNFLVIFAKTVTSHLGDLKIQEYWVLSELPGMMQGHYLQELGVRWKDILRDFPNLWGKGVDLIGGRGRVN